MVDRDRDVGQWTITRYVDARTPTIARRPRHFKLQFSYCWYAQSKVLIESTPQVLVSEDVREGQDHHEN